MKNCLFFCVVLLSPSSRAEWVEIVMAYLDIVEMHASPSSRAEWVEIHSYMASSTSSMSPSSRAEWVEIF